jgi:hypothetical protein
MELCPKIYKKKKIERKMGLGSFGILEKKIGEKKGNGGRRWCGGGSEVPAVRSRWWWEG